MTVGTASWVGVFLANGRYQVNLKLGEGGMGTVYRARDRNLDCDVVIKVPRPAVLDDEEFAGRFAREIRSLVQLQHPHVVRVLDVGEQDGLPFAVMQFLAGGSLHDRMCRKPAPPVAQRLHELRQWLAGVASALDFIHARHFIHRDVKPENILFDEHGHPYLSDFGVAKVLADNEKTQPKTVVTGAGMVLGTPAYMAPETIQGHDFDGRADQYALAVTVYEVLSGKHPFEGPTAAAVFIKHSTEEPPFLSQVEPAVPRKIAAAIHQALAKDPKQRYACCAMFAQAVLDEVAKDVGSLGAPTPATAGQVVPMAANPSVTTVSCPRCKRSLKIAATAATKRLRCPACQEVFQPAPSWGDAVVDWQRGGMETARTAAAARPTPLSKQPAAPVPTAKAVIVARPVEPPAALVFPQAAEADKPLAKPFRPAVFWAALGGVLLVALGSSAAVTAWLLTRPSNPKPDLTQPIVQPAPDPGPIAAVPPVPNPKPAPAERRSFSIHVQADVLNLQAGQSVPLQVQIKRENFPDAIRVEIEALPEKIACEPPMLRDEGFVGTFQVTAARDAEAGEKRVVLVATAGDLQEKKELTLRVSRPAPAPVPPPAPNLPPPPVPGKPTPRPGEPLWTLKNKAQCVAFSPGGRYAAVGCTNGEVLILDMDLEQKILRAFKGHPGVVTAVAFPTNDTVYAASGSTLRSWGLGQDGRNATFDLTYGIFSIAVTSDGKRLYAGHSDEIVRLWDLNTGTEVSGRRLVGNSGNSKPRPGMSVALSPDGKFALAAYKVSVVKNPVHVFDLTTGKWLCQLEGHEGAVNGIAFSPDSTRALTCGNDKTVRYWNFRSTAPLAKYKDHKGSVNAAAFTHDGKRIVSVGMDGMVHISDAATGNVISTWLEHKNVVKAKGKGTDQERPGNVLGVAVSRDGLALTVSEDGIKCWQLPP